MSNQLLFYFPSYLPYLKLKLIDMIKLYIFIGKGVFLELWVVCFNDIIIFWGLFMSNFNVRTCKYDLIYFLVGNRASGSNMLEYKKRTRYNNVDNVIEVKIND